MSSEFDDFDSIDEGFDDFDNMDDGVNSPKDDRSPVTSALKDGVSGLKDSLLTVDPVDEVKKITSKLAPKALGDENAMAIDSITSTFQDELDSATKEIKRSVRPITTAMKRIAPKEGLIGEYSQKFLSLFDDNNSDNKKLSAEEILNNKVSSAMAGMGLTKSKEDILKEMTQEKMKFDQMKDQTMILQKMLANSSSLEKFTFNFTTEYYKKSIELQYRQVFLTKDIKEILAVGFDRLHKEQDLIVRNTGLPDYVKLKTTEAIKAQIRNNITSNVSDKLFMQSSWLDNVQNNIRRKFKNVKDNALDTLGSVGDVTEAVLDANDQTEDLADMGMSKSNMAGSMAGDYAKGLATDKLLSRLAKNRVFGKIFNSAQDFGSSPEDFLSGVQENNKGFVGKLAGFFKGFVRDPNRFVSSALPEDDLNDNVLFDKRTQNSVVKVIPGLLSKILKEVTHIRTGKEPEELTYNFTKDTFETRTQFNESFKSQMKRDMYTSGVSTQMKSFIDDLLKDSTVKLTDEEKAILAKTTFAYVASKKSLAIQYLEKNGYYDLFPDGMRDKIRQIFIEYTTGKDKEDGLNKSKDANRRLRSIRGSIENPVNKILDYKDSGKTQFLVKNGILKYNKVRDEYDVDLEKYYDLMEKLMPDAISDDFTRAMEMRYDREETGDEEKDVGLKDLFKSAKDEVKNIDKVKIKNWFTSTKKSALDKLKDLDEKIANATIDDFKKMGITSKDSALKYIKDVYGENIPEEYRKNIEDNLNKVFNSTGYKYAKDKVVKTKDYVKNTDKDTFIKDIQKAKKSAFFKSKKIIDTVKNTKIEDLKSMGANNVDQAMKKIIAAHDDLDIKTLKRIESELAKKYKQVKDSEFVKKHKDSFTKENILNVKDTLVNKTKNLPSLIKKTILETDLETLKQNGYDNANEVMKFIYKKYPDLKDKDYKEIIKIVNNKFKTNSEKLKNFITEGIVEEEPIEKLSKRDELKKRRESNKQKRKENRLDKYTNKDGIIDLDEISIDNIDDSILDEDDIKAINKLKNFKQKRKIKAGRTKDKDTLRKKSMSNVSKEEKKTARKERYNIDENKDTKLVDVISEKFDSVGSKILKGISNLVPKKKEVKFDSDGDGIRDGSWKDRLKFWNKKEETKKEETSKKNESTGLTKLFSLLGDVTKMGFSSIMGGLTGLFGLGGGLISLIGTVFGGGNIVKNILKVSAKGFGKSLFKGSKSIIASTMALPTVFKGVWNIGKFFKDTLLHPINTIKKVGESAIDVVKAAKNFFLHPVDTLIKGLSTVKSVGFKEAGKLGAKSLTKKIPGIGLLAGIYFAIDKFKSGDYTGAGLEIASGLLSMIPGIGTAASVAVDGYLAFGRGEEGDVAKAQKEKINNLSMEMDEKIKERVQFTDVSKYSDDYKKTIRALDLEIARYEIKVDESYGTRKEARKKKLEDLITKRAKVIAKANEDIKLESKNNKESKQYKKDIKAYKEKILKEVELKNKIKKETDPTKKAELQKQLDVIQTEKEALSKKVITRSKQKEKVTRTKESIQTEIDNLKYRLSKTASESKKQAIESKIHKLETSLKNYKDPMTDKKDVIEKNKKEREKIREEYRNKTLERVDITKKILKETDPTKKAELQKQLDSVVEKQKVLESKFRDNLNTPLEVTDSEKNILKNNKLSKDDKTIVPPINIKQSTSNDSGVFKGTIKAIAYIIRKVETNNDYTKTGEFNGEKFISFGAYQFIERYNILKSVLTRLLKMGPTYKKQLKLILSNMNSKGRYIGNRSELISFLKHIGNDPMAKKAQDLEFYEKYYKPVLSKFKKAGLKNNLVLLHLVDHAHNRGLGNVNKVIIAMNGEDTMSAVVDARFADYMSNKKLWSKFNAGYTNRINKVSELGKKYIKGSLGEGSVDNSVEAISKEEYRDLEFNDTQNDTSESGGLIGNLKMALNNLLDFFGVKTDTISFNTNNKNGTLSNVRNLESKGEVEVDTEGSKIKIFIETIKSAVGKPYKLGTEGPDMFDCSGLVYYALNKAGFRIPRLTASDYFKSSKGKLITSFKDLKVGDSLFFKNKKGNIHHVATITSFDANGTPILTHAKCTKCGILTEKISKRYMKEFIGAKRWFESSKLNKEDYVFGDSGLEDTSLIGDGAILSVPEDNRLKNITKGKITTDLNTKKTVNKKDTVGIKNDTGNGKQVSNIIDTLTGNEIPEEFKNINNNVSSILSNSNTGLKDIASSVNSMTGTAIGNIKNIINTDAIKNITQVPTNFIYGLKSKTDDITNQLQDINISNPLSNMNESIVSNTKDIMSAMKDNVAKNKPIINTKTIMPDEIKTIDVHGEQKIKALSNMDNGIKKLIDIQKETLKAIKELKNIEKKGVESKSYTSKSGSKIQYKEPDIDISRKTVKNK